MTFLTYSLESSNSLTAVLGRSRTPASRSYGFVAERSVDDERTIILDRAGASDRDNIVARLQHAHRAISSYYRYLGAAHAMRLHESFASLFDPIEFDGNLPDVKDIDLIVKVCATLASPLFSVDCTSGGAMSVYWSDGPRTFYASTLNERIDWAEVEEGADSIDKKGSTGVTYADLLAARGVPAPYEVLEAPAHS